MTTLERAGALRTGDGFLGEREQTVQVLLWVPINWDPLGRVKNVKDLGRS